MLFQKNANYWYQDQIGVKITRNKRKWDICQTANIHIEKIMTRYFYREEFLISIEEF